MEYLPIHINFQSKVPLAEQIAERIRALIQSGSIKPGDLLPTVRQLAFQVGVNFNTVARAYRALDAEGLIITWQGRGTFVEAFQGAFDQQNAGGKSALDLVAELFEQAREQNIAEKEIWQALKQRQKESISKETTRRKKTRPKKYLPERNGDTGIARTGISLRQPKRNVYARKPARQDKHRTVSRETSLDLLD